ncbi:MAG: hypothetical protein ABSH20_21590 [Tepidisphaeraceae bacterium]
MTTSLLLLVCLRLVAEDQVIPLKVESGAIEEGRDSRIFNVPVNIRGDEHRFIWACGGWTTIRESLARDLSLPIAEDDETAGYTDASGQPMFVGKTRMPLSFGGIAQNVSMKVARDAAYNKGLAGIIGYDVASRFQWEVNPDPKAPTLTLRPAGTARPANPLATLPLRDEADNLWIPVTIRNASVEVLLAPQLSDIQAAPDMQKAWDIETGQGHDVASEFGNLRTRRLVGAKDVVELSPEVREAGCTVMLVGDKNHPERTPNARSGLGQSFLNRFTYCVDPRIGKFWVLKKMHPPRPTTRPHPAP